MKRNYLRMFLICLAFFATVQVAWSQAYTSDLRIEKRLLTLHRGEGSYIIDMRGTIIALDNCIQPAASQLDVTNVDGGLNYHGDGLRITKSSNNKYLLINFKKALPSARFAKIRILTYDPNLKVYDIFIGSFSAEGVHEVTIKQDRINDLSHTSP